MTDETDRYEQRSGNAGVAADEGDTAFAGEVIHAAIKFVNLLGAKMTGDTERDNDVGRHAAHGGDVAQINGKGFVAKIEERSPLEIEMDAFEEQVRRHQARCRRTAYPCGIVADAEPHATPFRRRAADLVDESEFTELAELHKFEVPIGSGSNEVGE